MRGYALPIVIPLFARSTDRDQSRKWLTRQTGRLELLTTLRMNRRDGSRSLAPTLGPEEGTSWHCRDAFRCHHWTRATKADRSSASAVWVATTAAPVPTLVASTRMQSQWSQARCPSQPILQSSAKLRWFTTPSTVRLAAVGSYAPDPCHQPVGPTSILSRFVRFLP